MQIGLQRWLLCFLPDLWFPNSTVCKTHTRSHTCVSALRHLLKIMWNIAVVLLSCLMSHFKERRKAYLYRPWCSCHQNSLCKPVTKNRRQWFVYCLQIKLKRKPSQKLQNGPFSAAALYISKNGWCCFCPREDCMHVRTSQLQTTKTPAFSTLTTSSKGSVCPNCLRNSASGPLSLSFVTLMKKYYI